MLKYQITISQKRSHFFCGDRYLNLRPYIYYALSISIELSSQKRSHLIKLNGFINNYIKE